MDNKSSTRATYNTPPVQVANNIQDGDQFVLITKNRRGETSIWGSTDQQDTAKLYQSVSSQFSTSPGQSADQSQRQTEPAS